MHWLIELKEIQVAIKFVDLAAQNQEVAEQVERMFTEIHLDTAYVGGFHIAAFEREFARFLGVRNVVGVGSGTDALRLALLASGIGPGDEVITTPMTFIASVEAILQTGARPVLLDVDPKTANMSVTALERYLEAQRFFTSNGPRAILPVDLYGLPAAMTELREVALKYKLRIVEDACQAHGARIKAGDEWVMAGGALPHVGCFSFYPAKNLGAWGEGGAVATNDDALAAEVALLRDHGRTSHYEHSVLGYNARLDTLQAAVLLAKLERLAQWNANRRRIADLYRQLLSGTDLELPDEPKGIESCYHLYVIRSDRRDLIREALTKAQIGSGIHYPVPLHLQPVCRFLGYQRGEFPVSERLAETVLSLPMHPHLKEEEAVQVARTIGEVIEKAS
jgi:dTDP-4-amino-4,6-dideoxygalactose transaminase